MKRYEAIQRIKAIAADLSEKAGNTQHECNALEDLAGNLERAVEMLENDEDGYIYLQMGEEALGNICHIDMYDLEDVENLLEEAKEILYEEAD